MDIETKDRIIAAGFWLVIAFIGLSVFFLYQRGADTLAEAPDTHQGPQDAIRP